ncbi:hypothetical protein CKM354_000408700 [Cercospora kikuchii]|uniref:Uncharacterized protein n=1 Tax=Cercospora kikuchii TaxID=84275 RepID=A0A9P3CHZ2_9PEZI|nr:uncharacterized protein CKM354_000408700 [Cercospora kikuchii]GIZ40760.1 hypothetical protein CKM354_000408700 [Cercospora kikuchii]
MMTLSSLLDKLNFAAPGGRWQLVELGDLWLVPRFVYHDLQDNFAAAWIRQNAIVQTQSPAALAAEVIYEHIKELNIDDQPWRIIDICSGSGRLASHIESSINSKRRTAKRQPIPFQLSDLQPNAQLDAWMYQASLSKNLTFIPQAVDPARPPFAAISSTTRGDKEAALRQGYESNGTQVYRLMSSFHRFDDNKAVAILRSTLQTADAFTIIELQERRIFSFIFVVLENCMCFLFSVFWFRGDVIHLFFTYVVPVLPVLQRLDRIVSCIRTRSNEETIVLLERAAGHTRRQYSSLQGIESVIVNDWKITQRRRLHTWPIGYMTIVTGHKSPRQ